MHFGITFKPDLSVDRIVSLARQAVTQPAALSAADCVMERLLYDVCPSAVSGDRFLSSAAALELVQ